MAKTLTAPASIKDGRLYLTDRKAFDAQVATWADTEVTLSVSRKTRRRSSATNRWLHGVALPVLMEAVGYDRDEMRDEEQVRQVRYALLSKCFGTKRNRIGDEVPRFTSSELDTEQMNLFMEWLPRYAAKEYGVRIPLPDDPMVDALIEHYGVAA